MFKRRINLSMALIQSSKDTIHYVQIMKTIHAQCRQQKYIIFLFISLIQQPVELALFGSERWQSICLSSLIVLSLCIMCFRCLDVQVFLL